MLLGYLQAVRNVKIAQKIVIIAIQTKNSVQYTDYNLLESMLWARY